MLNFTNLHLVIAVRKNAIAHLDLKRLNFQLRSPLGYELD